MTEGHYPDGLLLSFSKMAGTSFERTGEPLATRLRHQYLEKNSWKTFWPSTSWSFRKGWHDEFIIGGSCETYFAVRNEIMTCKHPCRRQLRVVKNKLIPTHLICPDLNIPVCLRFIPFNGELIRRQSSTPDPRWRGWPWGLIEFYWWGQQNTISKEQKS